MGIFSSHQFTTVSEIIYLCCSLLMLGDDNVLETQVGLLIEAIRTQNHSKEPGALEAARAIRKKLKYGTPREQVIALKILDLLVLNGIEKDFITPLFNDDKLIDRLAFYLIDDIEPVDFSSIYLIPRKREDSRTMIKHRKVCVIAKYIMGQWHVEYRSNPCLEYFNSIYERSMERNKTMSNKSNGGCTFKVRSYDNIPGFINDDTDLERYTDLYYKTPTELSPLEQQQQRQ